MHESHITTSDTIPLSFSNNNAHPPVADHHTWCHAPATQPTQSLGVPRTHACTENFWRAHQLELAVAKYTSGSDTNLLTAALTDSDPVCVQLRHRSRIVGATLPTAAALRSHVSPATKHTGCVVAPGYTTTAGFPVGGHGAPTAGARLHPEPRRSPSPPYPGGHLHWPLHGDSVGRSRGTQEARGSQAEMPNWSLRSAG